MMHRLLTGLLATEPLLHRARRRSSPGVTVLMYHEVLGDDDAEAWTAVRVSELRRQIEYLKSAVDLSLIRLPHAALMFPAISVSFATPRHPRNFSRDFAEQANLLGFGKTRFHDLRGVHSTALLDAGIPVHTVARRIGDDPATLLRNYTKRKRLMQATEKLSHTLAGLAAGFLGAD